MEESDGMMVFGLTVSGAMRGLLYLDDNVPFCPR
jgi:hypothetical protein